MSDQPTKGDRAFRLWSGAFTGSVWAGMMVYDGERWCSTGKKHDVTEDFKALTAEGETE